MTQSPGIFATELHFRYRRHVALAGVDLQIGRGVLGLLGPNGAGKTTLLQLLATLQQPARGALELLGFDPRRSSDRKQIRRRLGYLPQTMGYFPDFTATEFVEYFALMKGVPPSDVDAAVARALGRVGLEERARSKLKVLSGGQVRRVGIAQAIVNEPELLLLDEPTAGLDPGQRVTFRDLVRELGRHSTVVVSTHLVEDVAAACSQVLVLSDGRVVFKGSPDQLVQLGSDEQVGDSPIERGYSGVLGLSDWSERDARGDA